MLPDVQVGDGLARASLLVTGRRVGSWRWWFEHRETGEITIAQFPNWPLWGIGAGWLAGRVADGGSTPDRLAAIGVTALWVIWGADELLRGVNPWRRVLGASVLGWQALRLIL